MCADAADRDAIRIAFHLGPARNPPDFTGVRADDAEFALEGIVVLETAGDVALELFTVVGVDHAQPVGQRQLARARRQARLRDEAFRDARNAIAARLEVAEPRRLVDQPQPFLALPQRLLGLAAFGDVEVRADRAGECAVLVVLHARVAGEPAHFAVVGADDPELRGAPFVLAGHGGFDRFDQPSY